MPNICFILTVLLCMSYIATASSADYYINDNANDYINHNTGLPNKLKLSKEANDAAKSVQYNKILAPITYNNNLRMGIENSRYTSESTVEFINDFGFKPKQGR